MVLPPNPARVRAEQLLSQMEPSLPSDPLIQSCFWDITFMLHNMENVYGTKAFQNLEDSMDSIRNGIRRGYPTAYFYNELGTLYSIERQYGDAERAFKNAIHAPLDLTMARDNLESLREMEKTGTATQPGKMLP
jgi:uncharacterized protein HemY